LLTLFLLSPIEAPEASAVLMRARLEKPFTKKFLRFTVESPPSGKMPLALFYAGKGDLLEITLHLGIISILTPGCRILDVLFTPVKHFLRVFQKYFKKTVLCVSPLIEKRTVLNIRRS
jgi:hypothetical protein